MTLPEGLSPYVETRMDSAKPLLPKGLSPIQQPSLIKDKSEVVSDIQKKRYGRIQEVTKTFEDYANDKINTGQLIVQTVGKGGAGMTADYVGEGINQAINFAGDVLSSITPDVIEKPVVQTIKNGLSMLTESKAGELAKSALKGGWESWLEFKDEYPEVAKDVESLINITAILPPAPKRLKGVGGIEPLKAPRTAINRWASRQTEGRNKDFVTHLVSDTSTKQGKIDASLSSREVGLTRTTEYQPDEYTQAVINTLSNKVDVDPARSYQYNLDQLQKANNRYSALINERTLRNPEAIPLPYSVNSIDNAVDSMITASPVFKTDESFRNMATLYTDKAADLIAKYPQNANGMLKARQEFDKEMRKQKGKLLFSDQKRTAVSEINKTIRNEMNSLIEQKVPGVKQSLREQSHIIQSLEPVAIKAGNEANSAIGRTVNKLTDLGLMKAALNRNLAVLMGTSAFGAATVLSSGIVASLATGAGAYSMGKFIASPKMKKAVAQLMTLTDKAIKASTDPYTISQLKADRVILMDALKAPTEEETEEQN